jgi:putative membrane protein
MHKRNADVLSVFPTQIMKSWGEYFIVPLMNWLLLTFLPLKKVYTSENKSFVAANGQFIMFKRRVYDQIEGHKSVKDEVVEDMAFARLLKSAGFRLVTALGHTSIFCRMYDSFDDAYNGFVKNFFPGFRINPFLFWCFILLIQLVYMLPIVMSFIDINFLIVTFAIILNRLLISFTSNQNPLIGIIHPLQMFLLIMIGYSSVNSHRSGKCRMERTKIDVEKYSVYFLYIIFSVGVVGHIIDYTFSLMLFLTPFTLLLANLVVIFPHIISKQKNILIWIFLVYAVTLTLEIVGVKTGLIFGEYEYGKVLGVEILEVPLIIGFNWTIICLSIATIIKDVKSSLILKGFYAGFMAVFLDFFIEPIAIKLDYWTWSGGTIPLQNYFAWFVISFLAVAVLLGMKINLKNRIAFHYFFIQLMFFILLNIFI